MRPSIAVALLAVLSAALAHPNALAASLATAEGLAQVTGVPCGAQQPSAQSLLMDRKKGRVPVIGQTQDCKYPVYDLKGELNDLNYFSRDGDIVWQPGLLLGRMVFLDPADLKTGAYQCDYVCKDKAGRIVGMNPSYRSLLKKK